MMAALLGGCSGVYKSSQTPDDVYYSPARGARETATADNNNDEYIDYTSSTDDNYLRMKVQDRYRWSTLDDYAYWNDSRYYYNSYYLSPYSYSPYWGGGLYNSYYWGGFGMNLYPAFGLGWSYWSPGYYWNNWYSPYYGVVYYKNPKVYTATTSGSNLSAFKNRVYNNSNTGNYYNYNRSYYNKNDGNQNFGSLVRRVFTPANNSNNNNNNNNWERPVRTFNNNNSNFYTPPSSNAGGRSGGFNSSGSSVSPRPSRN